MGRVAACEEPTGSRSDGYVSWAPTADRFVISPLRTVPLSKARVFTLSSPANAQTLRDRWILCARHVQWSGDGQRFAFISAPGIFFKTYARVFDTTKGKVIDHVQHERMVKGIALSQDGCWLASLDSTVVHVKDLQSHELTLSLPHAKQIRDVAWLNRTNLLLMHQGSSLRAIQPHSGETEFVIPGLAACWPIMRLSFDESIAAVPTADGKVYCIDLSRRSFAAPVTYETRNECIPSLDEEWSLRISWARHDNTLVVSTYFGVTILRALHSSPQIVHIAQVNQAGWFFEASLSSDGRYVAIGRGAQLYFHRTSGGSCLLHRQMPAHLWGLAWHPSDEALATSFHGAPAQLWHWTAQPPSEASGGDDVKRLFLDPFRTTR